MTPYKPVHPPIEIWLAVDYDLSHRMKDAAGVWWWTDRIETPITNTIWCVETDIANQTVAGRYRVFSLVAEREVQNVE